MKFILTNHLKERLMLRGISDNLRNRHIVVSKVTYKGKLRRMLAAYDIIKGRTEVVTTHPITDNEIKNRLISGRWSYEKT